MTLPSDMQVIEITEPGAPDVLKPARRPVPEPGAGEILIKVHAAGVNRPDALQRAGAYDPPPGAVISTTCMSEGRLMPPSVTDARNPSKARAPATRSAPP